MGIEIILGILLISVLITALPINSILIYILVKDVKQKKRTGKSNYVFSDILLVCLFATSALQSIFSCPLIAMKMFFESYEYNCNYTTFAVFALANSNIMQIAMLSMHRILLVEYPMYAQRINKQTYVAVAASCFTWFYGVIIALPPLFGWSRYIRIKNRCTIDWESQDAGNYLYIAFCLLFSFIFPVVVLVMNIFKTPSKAIAKARIYRQRFSVLNKPDVTEIQKDQQPDNNREDNNGNSSNKQNDSTQRKARLYKISCITMAVIFVGLWLPYTLLSMMITAGVNLDENLYGFTSLFGKASALLIPLAHGFIYRRRYKSSLRRVINQFSAENSSAV